MLKKCLIQKGIGKESHDEACKSTSLVIKNLWKQVSYAWRLMELKCIVLTFNPYS